MVEKKKVFISYKRNVDPDEQVALDIYSQLSELYDVFIDLKMMVGTKWSKEIKENLLGSDCFISLISENSIKSEMISTEILIAFKQSKVTGSPLILPVRLDYFGDLDYDLMAYLGSSNYITWKSYSDTQNVVNQLRQAIEGHKLSNEIVLDIIKQRAKNTEKSIRKLLYDGDFEKALEECKKSLEQMPEFYSIHLLSVVAMLKGNDSVSLSTSVVKRMEKHLEYACRNQDIKPTALILWAIIKHDHYLLNGLYQLEPSLNNIKHDLATINLDKTDIELLELVKIDQITYNALGLSSILKKKI